MSQKHISLDWQRLDRSLVNLPLCVDLDGTLIHGHSLWQLKVPFSVRHYWPLSWPLIKTKIAASLPVDGSCFQYYDPLVAYLRYRKKQGQRLFLVTGAPERIAQAVMVHLNIFDDCYASSCEKNLVAKTKAQYLESTFGAFAYIGNSWKDLPVWRAAKKGVCVAHSGLLLRSFLKKWHPSLIFL